MSVVAKWVRSYVRSGCGKKCQQCGRKESKKVKLTIHHIKPRCTHPELTNVPSNCTLLCEDCHRKLH